MANGCFSGNLISNIFFFIGFRQLPLGTIHDFVLSKSNSSSQVDLSLAASIPKEQSFAFDVDQIMGYYQGTGPKHTEPMGRNSRHFSPTPYFSTSSHHHHGSHMRSHPGLTQGHAPLPRRPRQGKNTSPTPSTTFSSASALVPAQPSLFPSQDGADSGYYSTPLIDPFATPGSASVGADSQSQSHPSPTSSEGSVNMYQNPFSSSLWGLPTSLDNDEWMLYMQSGGGGVNGINGSGGNQLPMNMKPDALGQKGSNAMFDPMSDLNSTSLFDQSSLGLSDNASRSGRMHPLAQSLTRNDLIGENMGPKGQNNTSGPETSQAMNVDVFSPTANKLPTSSNSSPNQSLMTPQSQTQDYDFLLSSMGSMGSMGSLGNMGSMNMSLLQQIPQ